MHIKDQLILHEGKKLKLYKDTKGKWTIGIGRNLSDRGVNEDEIDLMFRNDLLHHWIDLAHALPWVADLSIVRRNVMIDMTFNMGITKLLRFKATLAAIKEGRYKDAARHMLHSLWKTQVGERAHRLAWMMETNQEGELYGRI